MTTRRILAYQHHCERCGHVWETLLEKPKACRNCKTRDWATPATGKRGRPRTLPDALREDLTRYNREYARKRRMKEYAAAENPKKHRIPR